MKELSVEQIRACSFQVLKALAEVCRENGLSYSLTGGTLLGAVRHRGFIPWDDDIDIMMPRPDYDRLIRIMGQGDYGFDLRCRELDGEAYGYPFAKACCRGTLVREAGVVESEKPIGVFVDIFPVDGAGNRYNCAKIRTMCFQILHGLKVMSNWSRYHTSKLRKRYYEPLRYICFLLSRMLGRKRIDRMMERVLRRKSYENSRWAGRLVGDHGCRELMPKSLFEDRIPMTFEGETFQGVRDYDRFLSSLYGAYMQLPPAEKQVTHHAFQAYWVE